MSKYKSHSLNSVYATGLNTERQRSCLSIAQKEWAYTKWCEGYSLIQIAEAFGVCEKTIRRAIHGRPRIRPILIYREDKNEKMAPDS